MTRRALVLGGGGVTGVAWELGLIAGLAEAGLDLRTADRFIGTSAGSVVAAQITSDADLTELYQQQLAGPGAELTAKIGANFYATIAWALLTHRDGESFRRRIGAMALAAKTLPEAERREVIAARLPSDEWPEAELLITTVRTDTGEFVVWDRESGVGLIDAVGASCAVPGVWAPVTVAGVRYMDGGMRSTTNADLAEGCERIVVIAPTVVGGGGAMPKLSDHVAALRERAEVVVVVSPDAAAKAAIGRNVLDPAHRAPAARAGHAQAASVLAEIRAVWQL
ncbi:NTE family protein [Allocatelliglobosispora scoriae]|uniref:NTE family protein n=1 Tax=Allocatelliglobosispora scoriae TaxID=643052 RepID=A0A841C1K8_9ACTN|nr:patatin-like phospholipase family protein [Allocatelliglobosispora scoriae]MBB5872942.1 NTE family protein [Allocatelliglobosispora scoriae]